MIIDTIIVGISLIKFILVVFAFVPIYFISWWYRRSTKIKKTFIQTTGEIVGYSSYDDYRSAVDSSRRKIKMYTPTIVFTDHHQKSIQFDDKCSSSIKPEIGKTVQVLYNPECSYDAVVDRFLVAFLFLPIICAIVMVYIFFLLVWL